MTRLPLAGRLAAAPVRRVMAALCAPGDEGGGEGGGDERVADGTPGARFVGGCVRDLALGLPFDDIDIATPLHPDAVTRRLEQAGVRVLPTGVAHGTVTALAAPGLALEITTLRRDVETFGRQARVAFTDDWLADAARRDFTFNALSLGPDGDLYDPFDGLGDLRAGRVRFIGDAAARIDEDVLRLLRYFRFLARFGTGGPDAATLAVCADRAPLLVGLSAERVRDEVLKILAGPRPAWAWDLMVGAGVVAVILPMLAPGPARPLAEVVRLQDALGPDGQPVLTRLAALLAPGDADGAVRAAVALRLSNAQRDRLAALVRPGVPVIIGMDDAARRQALFDLGADLYRAVLMLRAAQALPEAPAAVRAAVQADLARDLAAAAAWVAPVFPLRGSDLLAAGFAPGPALGRVMADVTAWWRAADFQPGRESCLEEALRRR